MSLLTTTRFLAPALVALGGYALVIFSQKNGLLPLIEAFRIKGLFPSLQSDHADDFNLKLGFGPLDQLLGTMVIFFWPLTSGHEPAGALAAFLFAGQSVAALTLAVLEGARHANKGKIVSLTTFYGLFIQLGGHAVAAPSHLVASLFTSPLITSSTPLTPSDLSIPEDSLSGVPISIFLGFIVPTVIMALPQPSIISTGAKIAAITIWQPFPVLITISQYLWRKIVSPRTKHPKHRESPSYQLSRLRTVYKFALTISASAHIAALTLSISSLLFPGLFSPQVVIAWHPTNLFIPPNPFSDLKVKNVAQGVFWFIKWDYAVAAAAVLLFAVNSRYSKPIRKLNAEAGSFGIDSFLSILARVVAIGPMSTALSLFWERDEIVYATTGPADQKKSA